MLTSSTGASAGIGAACAEEFARVGANVILTARRIEKLEEIKRRIGAQFPSVDVITLQMDVSDRAKIKAAIAKIPEPFTEIHVVVNNAGLAIGVDKVENVTDDAIDTVFATNVKGLLYVTQEILPQMKTRNEGHVINISSIAGHEVYPGGGVYCASKHAVDALTRTLRMELIDTGINVTSIDPGLVETEFSMVRFDGDYEKAKKVYQGIQPLTATDIAEAVVFAASRKPHVQIASMVMFPSCQAGALSVSRKN